MSLVSRLLFALCHAAWWLFKTLVVAGIEFIGTAARAVATGIGWLAGAAVTLVTGAIVMALESNQRKQPAGPPELGIQAMRLGLTPQPDGTATAIRGGIKLTLQRHTADRPWRVEARAMHEEPVVVTTRFSTVPSGMATEALELARTNVGKAAAELELD